MWRERPNPTFPSCYTECPDGAYGRCGGTALRLDDEFSLFELLRDLFTKRFQGNILRHLNDNG
jgi:hypothetical protein